MNDTLNNRQNEMNDTLNNQQSDILLGHGHR